MSKYYITIEDEQDGLSANEDLGELNKTTDRFYDVLDRLELHADFWMSFERMSGVTKKDADALSKYLLAAEDNFSNAMELLLAYGVELEEAINDFAAREGALGEK